MKYCGLLIYWLNFSNRDFDCINIGCLDSFFYSHRKAVKSLTAIKSAKTASKETILFSLMNSLKLTLLPATKSTNQKRKKQWKATVPEMKMVRGSDQSVGAFITYCSDSNIHFVQYYSFVIFCLFEKLVNPRIFAQLCKQATEHTFH